ncbi:MAG: peptide-methionine (S)-S-oxide reductase MsrA [Patescibacteria group bacterium]
MMKYIFLGIAGLLVLGFIHAVNNKPIIKSKSESIKMTGEKRLRRESDKVALFAGGCFWSLESYFEKIPNGLVDVVSGYSGGASNNPTYENYAEGGHREVVEVTYDPTKISYGALVEYYFRHIDPTDADGSFYDRGLNYTSAIYYEDNEERKIAEDVITIINKEKVFKKPIATVVLSRSGFWPAEDYHQDYARNNALRYAAYRTGSGRDAFLKKTWEGKEGVLYKQ